MALIVIGVDQATKTLALHYLSDGPVRVIGPFSLELVYNSGAAFSLGAGYSPVLAAIAVILIIVLWRAARGATSAWTTVALGLVLGGAVGNLIDRLLRGNGGAVIDFVNLKYWPTFNVADSSIVIGVVIMIWAGISRQAR